MRSFQIFIYGLFIAVALSFLFVPAYAQETDNINTEETVDTDIALELLEWIASPTGLFFILMVIFSCMAGAEGGTLVGGAVAVLFVIFGAMWGLIPTYLVTVLIFISAGIIAFVVLRFMTGRE